MRLDSAPSLTLGLMHQQQSRDELFKEYKLKVLDVKRFDTD